MLDAVDAVDNLRDDLNDGDHSRPPKIRINLLKLHGLAMAVVNEGAVSQAPEMFDLAMDLEDQVNQMMTQLEHIQDTLSQLVALYPESLAGYGSTALPHGPYQPPENPFLG